MKRFLTIFLCLYLFLPSGLLGQTYWPDWESLDQRPVPEWFGDAKFGIFIHWGPYSVPAWSPKGTYSEWYQYWLENKTLFGNGKFQGDEVYQFHVNTYGQHFDYYEFAPMFTADLYEPADWAELFKASGAKYVVLTSKHHDGFTLWPNEQANDRGFPWNSMETGAKRDLAGDLSAAVKAVGLKMGFYYSLYEWFHPWWKNDRERFVDEHYLPQIKDLVTKYEPDILWGDGEWEMEAEQWKSQELLAWLYNESPVKDKILVNDRWGKGIRQHHGGYYTTEYEAGHEFDKPWEECRGMGFSFGYNRNEDAQDYNSTRALILMLLDIVSNGGNLLLDIGPDARGQIPPIMQNRLLEMGDWLTVNGEAIYGTQRWKESAQWTEGDRELEKTGSYLGGDYILQQTIRKIPGKAKKEVFFTQKEGNLYATTPIFPKDKLILKGVRPTSATEVHLLGYEQALSYRYRKGNLEIQVPRLTYDELPCLYAWVFRVSEVEP